MLAGIHILLTYTCNLKCDHCFLYSSTTAKGTFTLEKISEILREAKKIDSVQEIFFEGGEPFLFYPLMLEGVRMAKKMSFKVGIVTNGYWAADPEDSKLWLKPLSELMKHYRPEKHPICGPLLKGGPACLVEEHALAVDDKYVDECHLCYAARMILLSKFPEYPAPKQVYGL